MTFLLQILKPAFANCWQVFCVYGGNNKYGFRIVPLLHIADLLPYLKHMKYENSINRVSIDFIFRY